MKFTDGNWLLRKGVEASYARQVFELKTTKSEIRAIVSTRPIRHPGDTLQGPTLTVTLSSPLHDVIRVKIVHFEGRVDHGPHFKVNDSGPGVDIECSDEKATIKSGNLSAELSRESFGLRFHCDNQSLTSSPINGMALMKVGEGSHIQEQLGLSVGEVVYGFGERFTAFVKNGQVIDIWNEDGGTNSEQAYKNVPFYLTNRGYGVFVNNPGRVSFEVGSERSSRVGFSVPGEELEYFVIYGPTPKEVLEKLAELTGRPALPPAWSFGLWLSTSFTTDYDEKTVTSFIDGMIDRNLSLHVFHFDCFWMKGFHWTDFEWDPQVFPEPKAMLKRLHDKGLRTCVWINPYIAQASKLFVEGKEEGYFLKKPSGDVWQWDMWQPGMAIVDFTNPAASKWFQKKLNDILDMGVDALKTDFGERIPTDVVYHNRADPVGMHNYYTFLYNQCVFEVLEKSKGKGQAVLFARSATAGSQQFPVHWGGDCWSDFEAMAESLRGGLSLGLCGFGFWSHDIGGFEGNPPAALYKRWVAFGLLSSHSRLHGSSSYRVPWLFDEESCDVLRFFTRLKCCLMPYLFAKAVEAHERGLPIMRAMLLEFPKDPTCAFLDRQYMLGDNLLVAPVFSDEGPVEFYVPGGRWTSLLDHKVYEGGRWFQETHSFFSLPLLVRPNSILPVGSVEDKPDYRYAEHLTFQIYEFEDGASAEAVVPDLSGKQALRILASRTGSKLHVVVSGKGTWNVLMAGRETVQGTSTDLGSLIGPFENDQELVIDLK